ncbi:MAG: replication-associated recombination protein A [Gammaproteobacteria bacterium]|nr:replication-associated recombination protein A [Gammaproteobacteria bacterium]
MNNTFQPLAAKLRPRTLDEFFGQGHLVGSGKPLRQAIEQQKLHSMILWGPPGTGKTTIAKLLAASSNAQIENISAVLAGVKDIRAVVERARQALDMYQQPTILFVDEVHRFNKAQQDAFLPHVEDGVFTLIGATTENPSFELNNALLSRTRVYVLKSLDQEDMLQVIELALTDKERGLGRRNIDLPVELRKMLVQAADGDARQLLNYVEICADFADKVGEREVISEDAVREVLTSGLRRFDKGGESFYDQISALHKSVRGSAPDAALYWFGRMTDGGCDLDYVARRLVRMASEDIGNADPRALGLTLDAWHAYERLGSPEGELALVQAIVYLAVAPKSNATYTAFTQAMQDVRGHGSLDVPLHIRNAPTKLMKELGYGKRYRYAHDEPNAYAAGENYMPEELEGTQYYFPVERGLEIKIREKLARLRKLDQDS